MERWHGPSAVAPHRLLNNPLPRSLPAIVMATRLQASRWSPALALPCSPRCPCSSPRYLSSSSALDGALLGCQLFGHTDTPYAPPLPPAAGTLAQVWRVHVPDHGPQPDLLPWAAGHHAHDLWTHRGSRSPLAVLRPFHCRRVQQSRGGSPAPRAQLVSAVRGIRRADFSAGH